MDYGDEYRYFSVLELREDLLACHKQVRSWREVRVVLELPEVSYATLRDIATGHVPSTETLRKCGVMVDKVETWGNPEAEGAYIPPGLTVGTCGYRYCSVRFLKPRKSAKYHSPRCGVLERRLKRKESQKIRVEPRLVYGFKTPPPPPLPVYET